MAFFVSANRPFTTRCGILFEAETGKFESDYQARKNTKQAQKKRLTRTRTQQQRCSHEKTASHFSTFAQSFKKTVAIRPRNANNATSATEKRTQSQSEFPLEQVTATHVQHNEERLLVTNTASPHSQWLGGSPNTNERQPSLTMFHVSSREMQKTCSPRSWPCPFCSSPRRTASPADGR